MGYTALPRAGKKPTCRPGALDRAPCLPVAQCLAAPRPGGRGRSCPHHPGCRHRELPWGCPHPLSALLGLTSWTTRRISWPPPGETACKSGELRKSVPSDLRCGFLSTCLRKAHVEPATALIPQAIPQPFWDGGGNSETQPGGWLSEPRCTATGGQTAQSEGRVCPTSSGSPSGAGGAAGSAVAEAHAT